jgi:D-arginine dehydrogenase
VHQVIIIGAGIAGSSCAYFLAQNGVTDVLVLERESALGVHSTGRSAAVVHALVEDPVIRRLIIAGASFIRNPPDGFCEHPLLAMHGSLTVFPDAEWQAVRSEAQVFASEGLHLEFLTPAQARQRVPVLEASAFAGAVFDGDDGNIDVDLLLSSYIKGAVDAGATLRKDQEVLSLLLEKGRCVGVVANGVEHRARWIVNAAGAWASPIARLAGAADIEIQPYRRSAVTFHAPDEYETAAWPLVAYDSQRVYFKPESGRLLMSPMDADPVAPGDARPSDLRIAEGMERLALLAPAIVPTALERKWAGLRSFAPDRRPVVGEDPRVPGFFWLAGQGGIGIESSAALAEVAARWLAEGKSDHVDRAALDPRRFLEP